MLRYEVIEENGQKIVVWFADTPPSIKEMIEVAEALFPRRELYELRVGTRKARGPRITMTTR